MSLGRVLVLLILALGAGLYFPGSREAILGYARPMLNPVLRWTTSQELRRIAEDLEAAQSGLGTLPTGRGEFDLWLTDRYREESARVDAWGTRYTLLVRNDSFYVSSAGPDGRFGTEDDLAQGRGMAPRARAR